MAVATELETEWTLVQRVLAGDRNARHRLADRLIDAIHDEAAIALTRRADPRDTRQDVRDLVQSVLLYLFERDAAELRRWDPARGRNLGSFVRLIARHRIGRFLQRERRVGERAPPEEPAPDPTREYEVRAELDFVLGPLFARMTRRDARLFVLLFVEEREPIEAGRALTMSVGAVNAWRYRFRKLARAAWCRASSTNSPPSAISPPRARRAAGPPSTGAG
jgi:RNA polymerase sigma factor (sigma-70 family)